jgi:hypothetical protein
LTTTKPQSKLLKALEDKETERQRTKKMVSFQFFSSFIFGLCLGFAFQCSRSVMMSAKSKKAKKLDLLS